MYNHKEVEAKWRKYWADNKQYATPEGVTKDNKYYILPQLPYPSGSGLHVGHAEIYIACDIYSRFQRQQGKKVLQVMGWDAFGLPAENYAIKTNIHPRINTDTAIDNFREQIKSLGVSVDWDREVGSHNPDYYKWTQWFFLLMYEQGLAYRKKQTVNWCDSCKTVLANEQVIDGHCERCDSEIELREMEQWYLKITDYADKLIEGLDRVDWPEESIKRQRDWIGRSTGIDIDYEVVGKDFKVTCFTTTPVNFGATFIVVAPEYEYVDQLITDDNREIVEKYIEEAKAKTDLERQVDEKQKTGVFTGSYAINHLTGEQIPIWVADFVLASFGTGAVQGCPAHDERDFEFAKKFDLPIYRVVEGKDGETDKVINPDTETFDQVKIGKGIKRKMINSEMFNGLPFDEGMKATMDYFEEKGWGKRVVNYKLRDWSVSRQRFWGAPIPMLHKPLSEEEKALNELYNNNPYTVISFHAWGSSPTSRYHGWLGEQLAAEGIEYFNPELPNAENPLLSEWLDTMASEVGDKETKNSVVIGRSLGCWSALKFAENHKVRKLILAAPTVPTPSRFSSWQEAAEEKTYEMLVNFIGGDAGNLDIEKVKENVGELVVFLSTDDPYVELEETEKWFRTEFPYARIARYREVGHFDLDEFPGILEEIKQPVALDLKPLQVGDLPVILPDDVDFKPTGQSPLTYSDKFQDGIEKRYGEGWKREVDTLDTFMCSSWYFFRYLDPHNDEAFASKEALENWMPVDFYLGGPEHVTGHLLYSRFFTKVLYDAGYISFDEPFLVHRHQGIILGPDNRKMSKRWGNVINPTDVVNNYGADTIRMYEMFMGPLEQSKAWSEASVQGVRRFIDRIYKFSTTNEFANQLDSATEAELHKTIKKVTADTINLKFNTAISEFMKFINYAEKAQVTKEQWETFLVLMAPYAPFLTEELWQGSFGHSDSIHMQEWPKHDDSLLTQQSVTIAVQVNGKLRDTVEVEFDSDQEAVESAVKDSEKVQKYLENAEPKKVIYVKNKIINYII
ncbi:leucine--tRNA ligase [Candidatus Dojkabacteria bacterium]|uniref:Leucine--tRNA ligase n=1 Tax=Candidatus Dojkabacteria bacterium TaxID=2099670 RepID=A0A955RJ26_9BACT|nr:leucine--tRNA ligase [Candidatus Dojkabacteria bacterium]